MAENPEKILEVGLGNGTTSHYLRTVGYDVTTADYEENLNPDVVADVTKLPFKDGEFDAALCCEVLEHLPFSEFETAIKELTRVAKTVYVTVPDHRRLFFSITIKLPFLNEFSFSVRTPRYFTPHVFDGYHYWEIGKKDYPVRKILKHISAANVKVIDHGSYIDVPLIHYFLLQKK
ncbi:MAG: class I SAM-dependent methyltransferase [Candidatus Pacebacteria bacterium]|nr:class I SAM-dependent methyltransferase [Candidatus Paceibacterota bacterium]